MKAGEGESPKTHSKLQNPFSHPVSPETVGEREPRQSQRELKMVGITDGRASHHATEDISVLIKEKFAALQLSFRAELKDLITEALKSLTDKLDSLTTFAAPTS